MDEFLVDCSYIVCHCRVLAGRRGQGEPSRNGQDPLLPHLRLARRPHQQVHKPGPRPDQVTIISCTLMPSLHEHHHHCHHHRQHSPTPPSCHHSHKHHHHSHQRQLQTTTNTFMPPLSPTPPSLHEFVQHHHHSHKHQHHHFHVRHLSSSIGGASIRWVLMPYHPHLGAAHSCYFSGTPGDVRFVYPLQTHCHTHTTTSSTQDRCGFSDPFVLSRLRACSARQAVAKQQEHHHAITNIHRRHHIRQKISLHILLFD